MFRGFIRIASLVLICHVGFSQHYTTPFGQNRIQYKNLDWYYYSTNNFDIYYYPGGHEYALEAIDFLEDEFVNLTDKLGYAPYNKTKILIYNSIHDLQQSNVGIDGAVYTIGGRTDFVKLQVEVAYPGKAFEFKQDLFFKLTSTLIQDMMYGGSLAEIFQNSYLLTLPDWFIDGAARYMAYGWTREMDDYLRDYMSRKKIKKLKRIDSESAGIVGQSIWNYIAVKYGESNISNILNLTRIIRKEENSIANTLGISFKSFLNDWQNYYLLQREEVAEGYVVPSKEDIIDRIRGNKELINSSIQFNSDANKVAYATIKSGKYQVFIQDLETGGVKKITEGGYRINGQDVDRALPLLDWQDNENLGVILFKRGFLYLNIFNTETGRKFQKPLNRFRQIESFAFNDNGKLAIISGNIDGQNNLFLISMRRNALRRITDDAYDDLDPAFIPGTAAFVFSSNRVGDSTKVNKIPFEELNENFNLFIYDLDTTTNTFYRLTNTYSEDRKPYVKNKDEIYYLSDQRGISNLFRYSFRDSTAIQVTSFDKSVVSYDLHFSPDRFSYIMLDRGKEKVFYDSSIDLYSNNFTPETPRKRRENAMMVVSRVIEKQKSEEGIEEDVAEEPIRQDFNAEDFLFEDEEEIEENPDWIDTDNYLFEDETEVNFQPESFFSKYRNFERETERIGPIPYVPRFTFNNVITSFLWDPYRDFMAFTEVEINDVLENYKIKGGALIKTNLQQGDIFAEFHYLKYWMDFKIRIDRKTYLIENNLSEDEILLKYKMNRVKLTGSVPITHTFRAEISPFVTSTSFNNLNYQIVKGETPEGFAPNSQHTYVGGSAALIFDNTVEKEFNLYQGTRALLEFTSHFHSSNSNRNFSNLRFDFRHYQRIHKEFTWANRVLYGRHMGPAAKVYMLGGMDNWLFAKSDSQGQNDPLVINNERDNSDLFFNEFATNLRGLDYNEAFGQNALVINSELRLPVFQYLSNGPIKSNFLRNFQVISFMDIGSVWTGQPPFSKGRSVTQKFNEGEAFSAEIVKFQNPWLGGIGWGVRTVLLGYYIKFDAARPYLDGEIGNYRYYFTLGLDF
jgi:Tol biopolymer transport system component